ncbi:unnamed protein product [Leuciscus chuanchicus]
MFETEAQWIQPSPEPKQRESSRDRFAPSTKIAFWGGPENGTGSPLAAVCRTWHAALQNTGKPFKKAAQSEPELDRTIDKLFYNCLSVNTCDYDRGHESKTGWVDTTLKQWKSSRGEGKGSHQHPAAGLKAGSVLLKCESRKRTQKQQEK